MNDGSADKSTQAVAVNKLKKGLGKALIINFKY